MEQNRTDALRRWLVVVGLILGPALALLSVTINVARPTGSMRAQFDTMGTHAQSILMQDLLETLGFMFLLASLAALAQTLRSRGAALATLGSVLAVFGIAGFAFSNGSGLAVVALAQLPDHDAAFATATAITSSGVSAAAGTFGFCLEVLGQVGILLVIGGLVRARVIRIWPLLLVPVGIVVNAALGTMTATLIADVLLLATGTWVAVAVARAGRDAAPQALADAPATTGLLRG